MQLGLTFLQLLLISSLPRGTDLKNPFVPDQRISFTFCCGNASGSVRGFLAAELRAEPQGNFSVSSEDGSAEYTVINEACPGAEWNIMCRECCEYDQIECVCPGKKEVVGYTIPCCRNEDNECDSCLIHPGCTIFENCKTCRNGSWGGTLDDFYVKGFYCAECRAGWYGGDCMRCGQVLRASKGQIFLESYPLNAHCEWTIHAKPGFNIQLRFVMLSLEFDYMCQYDYVEVRDGDNSDGQIIKRFCGNERPAPIRSMGSSLHILFHSDGSKNFDGFHAIFEEITGLGETSCDQLMRVVIVSHHRVLSKRPTVGPSFPKRILTYVRAFIEERNCSDPGGPVNGYKKITGGPGLINGRQAKVGTVFSFFCNSSYVLSGNENRTCQQSGEWSGKQPICIKERKERDRELETSMKKHRSAASAHLHWGCAVTRAFPWEQWQWNPDSTPFSDLFCGKTENITAPKTQGLRWPWQAAIYRRVSGVHGGSLHKDEWFLVCSGALVNERTVVVAAHCVTDLGKVTMVKTADLKVVLGKFYRDDDRDEKTIQSLRISAIILHPNYDPILLDADIAVLKLLDKARISTRVQPICLAATRDLSTAFQEAHITVAGWNVLADVRSPGFKNDMLRSGVFRVVDSLICEEQHEEHGIPVSVTDNMFCASRDPALLPTSARQRRGHRGCVLPGTGVP
ncbi:hypothetical protein QTO34_003478 [Cnephaeus nilssonii]|uniref:Peptidase domain containing associated with muscle regeneration 1 n=1 Tax=Cnephaeus nilssonii TaxID=3371016 RepID=A0AA40LJZ3_CNENI|nr:hypothetical protein QTO34_003478 [Eptesicus nilssonii]